MAVATPRNRYNGLVNSLSAGITNADTAIPLSSPLVDGAGNNIPTFASGAASIPMSVVTPAGVITEFIRITAYTSGATTATALRGQDSGPTVSHNAGDLLIHAPNKADFGVSPLQTWVPVWGAATTNPTLGSGTIVGYYSLHGPVCHFSITITAAANTNFGSGAYTITLPIDCVQVAAGLGTLRDNGGNPYYCLWEVAGGGTIPGKVLSTTAGGASNNWAAASPVAWTASATTIFRFSGCYLWM